MKPYTSRLSIEYDQRPSITPRLSSSPNGFAVGVARRVTSEVTGHMVREAQCLTDDHSVVEIVEEAVRRLAVEAAISADESSVRIRLYARFRDVPIVGACQGILDGTIRLLTIRESKLLPAPAP